MKVIENIKASGHRLIQASHKTTLEITKSKNLSKKGNCIIAVSSDKSVMDLSPKFKEMVKKSNARIILMVEVGGISETIVGSGDPRLSLSHPTDIVIRKSNYICERTLAIKADKAAADLSRNLIEMAQNQNQIIKIKLFVS